MSVTFTMRMEAEQKQVIADFARLKNMSMAEFMIEAAMEKIEDELDLQAWYEAEAEYEREPVTYSLDEIKAQLGFA